MAAALPVDLDGQLLRYAPDGANGRYPDFADSGEKLTIFRV